MAASKLATFGFDNWTGYFDLAIREQQPNLTAESTTEGEWGLKWNSLMGKFAQAVFLLRAIAEEQGINVITIGHLAPSYIGKGDERRQNGWQMEMPGKGTNKLAIPFDEMYHLTQQPNAMGTVPPRKLICQKHLVEGFPFEAKSRCGITGPLGPPTVPVPNWDAVMKAVPEGNEKPRMITIVGGPGAGKTTFLGTAPKPLHIIDLLGGTQIVGRQEGVSVSKPKTLGELFRLLLKVRGTGTP